MLPAILECGIFKITEGPQDDLKITVECLSCSPKRVLHGHTKYTSSLLRHVRNFHPELLQKIKDKKNEQSNERKAKRKERAKEQRDIVKIFTFMYMNMMEVEE